MTFFSSPLLTCSTHRFFIITSLFFLTPHLAQALLCKNLLSQSAQSLSSQKNQVTVAQIKRDPKKFINLLKKKMDFTDGETLVKEYPNIAKKIINGSWKVANNDFLDQNGRSVSLNKKNQLQGKKAVTVYRGIQADSAQEVMLKMPIDSLFQPTFLAHTKGTFVTNDYSYAKDVYTKEQDGYIIEYEFPPQLLYKGGEGQPGREEFVVPNKEAFQRKATKAEMTEVLSLQGYSKDEIKNFLNHPETYQLDKIYDATPFILFIEELSTGREFTVEEFLEYQRSKLEE